MYEHETTIDIYILCVSPGYRLTGPVPEELGKLGCIVNLAGNPVSFTRHAHFLIKYDIFLSCVCVQGLQHGEDVPLHERQALEELYRTTLGQKWTCQAGWMTLAPICNWYDCYDYYDYHVL